MHLPKDDIELSIQDLKNVRINLLRYNSPKVQDSLKSINTAIAILEAYKRQINEIDYEPTPFYSQENFPKARGKISYFLVIPALILLYSFLSQTKQFFLFQQNPMKYVKFVIQQILSYFHN